jgi:hypothetical protein
VILELLMGTIIYGINLHCNTFLPGPSSSDISLEIVQSENRPVVQGEPESIQGSPEKTKLQPSPSLQSSSEVEITGNTTESCVSYAKRITGISKSIGNGGRSGINSDTPVVGEIGSEVKFVHAFVIESVTPAGVWALESNFVKGYSDRRFISYSDILGYIK